MEGRCINLCGELPPGAPNLVVHKFMNPDLARQVDTNRQLLAFCVFARFVQDAISSSSFFNFHVTMLAI